ncbi:hypothetical protein CSC17_0182 [Klebsiella oxytoca]|nr:hypothetical protein CSC17_0182 [Klebsiella oxytoca]
MAVVHHFGPVAAGVLPGAERPDSLWPGKASAAARQILFMD